MAYANVKPGNIPMICSDDDSDDGGTATGGKPGAKHVDTEKGVYNDKGEEYLWNAKLTYFKIFVSIFK